MTLMTVLSICNNYDHLIIAIFNKTVKSLGFQITWNNDHECHPYLPLLTWTPVKDNDRDGVIRILENFLKKFQQIYQKQRDDSAAKAESNLGASLISRLTDGQNEACPLTDERIEKIIEAIKNDSAVDTGKLFAEKIAVC